MAQETKGEANTNETNSSVINAPLRGLWGDGGKNVFLGKGKGPNQKQKARFEKKSPNES